MTLNYVDSTGLHTATVDEIITALSDGMRSIYGADINLNANSPDSQMINLFAQAVIDTLDSIVQVYNGFSPDSAVGSVLDQRCAINGVIRGGATFTRTNATLTTTQSVTLQGIDTNPTSPFTIRSTTGNNFALEETVSLLAGSHVLEFISVTPGLIETVPNTITVIATVTAGVSAVNNPDSAISTGVSQETDVALRIRRTNSVASPAQGWLPSMTGNLLAVDNVIGVKVFENDTNVTDANGIPAHTMWAVVDGGSDSDIGKVIYKIRNAGCGMKGSEAVTIVQVNGFDFTVLFDRPVYENLYIKLTVTSLDPNHLIDPDYLTQVIYNSIVYTIYQPADYTAITTVVKEADPNAVVISGGVSKDNITFSPFLYPTLLNGRFLNSIPRITITVV